MWSILRRHLMAKRVAGGAGGAGPCGLRKAPHVSQCGRWDCGVACAQMVLQGLGRDIERASLLAALGTRSVWTIDLAMLLHRYGVRFMYCTKTVGVKEAYSTVDFYRSEFDSDTRRVQALFKAAEEAKVGAVQKAFSWQELAVLLSGYEYAAIVLVDSRYLYPAYPTPNSSSNPTTSSAPSTTPVLTAPTDVSTARAEAVKAAACPPLTGMSHAAPSTAPVSALPGTLPAPMSVGRDNAVSDPTFVAAVSGRAGSADGTRQRQKDMAALRLSDVGRAATGSRRRRRQRRPPATAAGDRARWQTLAAVAVVADGGISRRDESSSGPIVSRAGGRDVALVSGSEGSNVSPVGSPRRPQVGRKRLRVRQVGGVPSGAEEETEWVESSSCSSSSSPGTEGRDTPPRLRSPLDPILSGSNCTGRKSIASPPLERGTLSPRSTKMKAVDSLSPSGLSSDSLSRLPEVLSAATTLCAPMSPTTATIPPSGSQIASLASPSPGLGPTAAPSSPAAATSSSYCGHYIVLVGWSEADGVFIARDPSLPSSQIAVSADVLGAAATAATVRSVNAGGGGSIDGRSDAHHIGICLTPEALDRARRSYGTDEDVIVIDLARSRRGGVAAGPLAAAAAATALTVSAATSAAAAAAAASALVGLLAMAAAAAAGAEASGFRESWGWPDPVAWFAKHGTNGGGSDGGKRTRDGRTTQGGGRGEMDDAVLPEGVPESTAKRLASLLSLAASGLRFTTVAEAMHNVRNSSNPREEGGAEERDGPGGAESASKRLASMLSLAASQLRFSTIATAESDNRTATMSSEARARAESAAKRLASLLSVAANGFRFPSASADGERERWADRVAHALEGLLEGGRWGSRRAAETMEGFFEGGRRAATQLRDSLADMGDAPGGAGWEDFHAPLPPPLAGGGISGSTFVVSVEEAREAARGHRGMECGWECASAGCGSYVGNSAPSDPAAVVSSA